jgi:hypothetical protein
MTPIHSAAGRQNNFSLANRFMITDTGQQGLAIRTAVAENSLRACQSRRPQEPGERNAKGSK